MSDQAAIWKLIEQFHEAFEKRDAALYAAGFSEDADWENAFGHRAQGRVQIQDTIRHVYPLFRDAKQSVQDSRIILVTPEFAVADVLRHLSGIVNVEGEPVPDRRVRTTHVLRKTAGRWQVVVFRAADLRDRLEEW